MACAATDPWVFNLNRLSILLQALSFLVVLILIRGGSWMWVLMLVILLALVYQSERAAKKKVSAENKATPP
jgi:biopolymer transport protein ExbB/TolQ